MGVFKLDTRSLDSGSHARYTAAGQNGALRMDFCLFLAGCHLCLGEGYLAQRVKYLIIRYLGFG